MPEPVWRVRFTPNAPREPVFMTDSRFADLPRAYKYARRNAYLFDARPLVFKERAGDAQ